MLRLFLSAFVACLVVPSVSTFAQSKPAAVASASAHEHDHSAPGPHAGKLFEVGKEEYHIELVVDETKKQLVVYLLDSRVKDYIALDLPFLALNLKMKGKPAQVKLLPMAQEIDKNGFVSRYGVTNSDLIDALHGGHADARLALKIGNKAYSVKIDHEHDHAGHSHAPAAKK